jgi:DNA polymerase-3 subunit beta
MRLAIEKNALLKALQHVAGVVERRATIPILSNVLLTAEPGLLRLKATDLDIEVSETVSAKTDAPGATTVSAHMLLDIVRKLPDGSQIELALEADGSRVSLRAGPARFKLQALPGTDFPDIATDEMTHRFEVPAPLLRQLLERTRFAISTEETRYYLNGIYLHTLSGDDSHRLAAVATDGHRLAKMELPMPEGAKGMPGIIVPRKTVSELFKLLGERDAPVRIELSSAKIRFIVTSAQGDDDADAAGSVVLTSKLIDGTFPDYGRVIPAQNNKMMTVDRGAFASATDRVSTLSSEKGRAVKLNLTAKNLVLSVNNPDAGSATEELDVDYSGEPLEIGFNARYLLDICQQIESNAAVFMLSDPSSPTLVRDAADQTALYVLMPMRV